MGQPRQHQSFCSFQAKSFKPGTENCGVQGWGWNNTTMKVLPRAQTQGEWCVLYLLHLYLPTLYTLQVATGLFLGHFRDIYFCKSYFWELCQIGNCSNLYLPHKNAYPAASGTLFLPQGAGTSLCRKKRNAKQTSPQCWGGCRAAGMQVPRQAHPMQTLGRAVLGYDPRAAPLCALMGCTRWMGVSHQAERGSLSGKQDLQRLL